MSNNTGITKKEDSKPLAPGERARVRPVFGRARNIMSVDGVPKGFTHRWFNDVSDRIAQKSKQGWDFLCSGGDVVVGDVGINTAKQQGKLISKNVGGGITAYCMILKDKLLKEDRKTYHNEVANSKASIDREGRGKKGFYGSVTTEVKNE